MTITKTFTDGPDSFVVKTADAYDLDFAGGDDILRILTGTTTAHLGLGDDRVRVDGGSVTIFGDAGNDRFYGNGTAISGEIDGGAGNDAFYDFAGAGVTLAGGAGNDLYRVVSATGPAIVENAGEGTDTVLVARGLSYTLGANIESLKVADALGSGEVAILTGNDLNNRIIGSSGSDTINGMGGNDTLTGGGGNDTFLFAAGGGRDVITDLTGGDVVKISGYSAAQSLTQAGADVVLTLSGTDKVTFSNASLATVQAALQFDPAAGSTITGTNGGDTLTGTAGDDVIKGLGGYDVINGGAGDDRIYGGLGGDSLSGGAGTDTFVYTAPQDAPPYGLMYWEFDTIYDWQSIDRIDLSAVDIDPALPGIQSFHFVGISDGQNIPDHTPGALYINKVDGYVWIAGYLDGDANPDFDIEIYGPDALSLSASNLIL
jgi:Ca2+-binding RTX toxin-like protein